MVPSEFIRGRRKSEHDVFTHLAEFWDVNQVSEVFEVGAFVVEFAQIVMLACVALLERLQGINVISSYKCNGQQKVSDRVSCTHFGTWLASCS